MLLVCKAKLELVELGLSSVEREFLASHAAGRRNVIEALNRRPFHKLDCGCVIRRHNAGDGWFLYDVSPCRGDSRSARRFWMAPCGCVAFSDGVRLVCATHAFLAVLMPMRSEELAHG